MKKPETVFVVLVCISLAALGFVLYQKNMEGRHSGSPVQAAIMPEPHTSRGIPAMSVMQSKPVANSPAVSAVPVPLHRAQSTAMVGIPAVGVPAVSVPVRTKRIQTLRLFGVQIFRYVSKVEGK